MKRIFYILFALAVLQPAYGQGLFGPNNSKSIRQGNLDYKKGIYDAAMSKYGNVLKNKPNDAIANYNLGTALYKSGNVDSAMSYFNTAIQSSKDDRFKSKAHYNMGNSYLSKKEFEKAIGSYKESLKLNPDDENARYNLAYANSMLQRQQKQQQKQQQQQNGQEGNDEDGKKENPQGNQEEVNKPEPPKENKSESKMTKEMAEQLMNALNNREKETMKNMKEERGAGSRKTEKDW